MKIFILFHPYIFILISTEEIFRFHCHPGITIIDCDTTLIQRWKSSKRDKLTKPGILLKRERYPAGERQIAASIRSQWLPWGCDRCDGVSHQRGLSYCRSGASPRHGTPQPGLATGISSLDIPWSVKESIWTPFRSGSSR